ncbi:MAG: glucose 1-dehydrogenase [Alphaproteobacteria bacterium]|nr:glucose 1-dehydrogenase [Alphaproteobacteria bacterium]
MAGRVAGKVALVSGAASGLGKATAERLAEEGAAVAIGDIRLEPAEAAAAAIRAQGGRAIALKLDVTQEADWVAAVAEAETRFGKLDVLVNNAGTADGHWIHKLSLAEWRRVHAINLDGVFLGLKYGAEAMKRAGGGSIVNISSVAGLVGIAEGATAYCASKGGVTMLTKAAALEMALLKTGVRVNSVHPGYMRTPMLEAVIEAYRDPAEARARLEAAEPLGRFGEPRDIANAVLYLASDESAFVTGAQMVVDGGFYAR